MLDSLELSRYYTNLRTGTSSEIRPVCYQHLKQAGEQLEAKPPVVILTLFLRFPDLCIPMCEREMAA